MLDWTESRQKDALLEETLNELRSLPGYERYLVPPSFQDIASYNFEGYVILLVPGKEHCDVVVLGALGNPYRHLRLPALDTDKLKQISSSFMHATTTYRDSICHSARKMKKVTSTTSSFDSADWYDQLLASLWITLVQPIIKFLNLHVSLQFF
jgi:hypothetical protein